MPCLAAPQIPHRNALTHRVIVFSFRSCSHCCCGTHVSGVVCVGGTGPGGFHVPDRWDCIPNGSDRQHLDQLHMLHPLQNTLYAAHHHLHVRILYGHVSSQICIWGPQFNNPQILHISVNTYMTLLCRV